MRETKYLFEVIEIPKKHKNTKEIATNMAKRAYQNARSTLILFTVIGIIGFMSFERMVHSSELTKQKSMYETQLNSKKGLASPPQMKASRGQAETKSSKSEILGYISESCERYGQEVNFVKGIARQESGFNQKSLSHAGAIGVMQLMPATAKSLGVNPYIAKENIDGGVKHLSYLMKSYNGYKELALAAYNAGSGAVKKYGGIPPYKETQNYVKSIMNYYKKYCLEVE
jgi:soluble lytic murein transglycosylase-like protein